MLDNFNSLQELRLNAEKVFSKWRLTPRWIVENCCSGHVTCVCVRFSSAVQISHKSAKMVQNDTILSLISNHLLDVTTLPIDLL